ncbi:MAG: hypothetical protein II874_05040 [Bacteroidales bacterium]|nr:hypothetical protein [Bacteroidales bacterium]
MRKLFPYLFASLLLWAATVPAWGQERKDSVVTLVSAKSAQLIEQGGQSYRKVVGPARFLHNNTYLLCDTALWNVSTNIIDAIGHVQIIQDRTRLSSGSLQYVVDDNLAKFRGGLVQLEDKDKNTLRTRYLDYNTKDSVAIFQNGAALRDKDGQIIESLYGSYDSKAQLFVFNDQVNMYMDTTFVKTSRLEYRSDLNTAYFGYGTDMWQDDNMLSANDGWYDRNQELFFFRRNVHMLTRKQETWSDTLYYHRAHNNVELLGKVEVMDTTRNVFALAGRMEYTDSISRVKMTRDPAIMSISDEEGKRDTLYVGADTLFFRGIKRNKVDSLWKVAADRRLQDLTGDPVTQYRRKAAEAAAKAAEEAAEKARSEGLLPRGATPPKGGNPPLGGPLESTPPGEGLALPDTLDKKPEPVDSTFVPPVDSTQLSFVWGINHVKLYRKDMQMSCDSLVYNDLDSLVRLYRDPLVFNDGNRQYAADSIFVVIRNRIAERARLMNNAFITTEEAPECYDQIRGTEMMAYFDSTRTLQRFDALGGATALFFLKENDALATVNKVDSKMLYAVFKDGYVDKMYYFDNAKNDAYPVVQLPKDERYMKGFRWNPERKPTGKEDITPLVPRVSQRTSYLARPHAQFKETNVYFPGHINKIYKDIAYRDSMEVVRARQPKEQPKAATPKPETAVAPEAPEAAVSDTTSVPPPLTERMTEPEALSAADDSLRIQLDSLAGQEIPVFDDSLSITTDSSSVTREIIDPAQVAKAAEQARKAEEKRLKEEARAQKRAEKEAVEAAKRAEREARWAEKDRIYEEKQAAKAQKKLEKERKRKLRALRKLEKKAQKERKVFERYLEKERARARKRAAREAEKARKQKEKDQTH